MSFEILVDLGTVYTSSCPDHAKFMEKKLLDTKMDAEWEVVLPLNNQIFLDYDQKSLPSIFYSAMDILSQSYSGRIGYTVSQSKRGNRHVIIHLPCPLDPFSRVAWQAVFGSDVRREALILRSLAKNEANPNLLIEKKDGKGVLYSDIAKVKQAPLVDTEE